MQVYTMMTAKAMQQHGMRINSVCPSPIDTPLLPDFRETMSEKTIDWAIEQSGRVAQPRDIALVLAFLGSDASGFVNGVNLERRPRLHRRHDDGPARLRRTHGLIHQSGQPRSRSRSQCQEFRFCGAAEAFVPVASVEIPLRRVANRVGQRSEAQAGGDRERLISLRSCRA